PKDVQFDIASETGQLPHFNPDLNIQDFPVLGHWVQQMKECDGLVISTPEYARGYPGTLKNALDWLVQTDAFIEKPFMMLNASARSTVGRDTLITVIQTMSGVHIESASTTIPLLGTSHNLDELLAMNEVCTPVQQAMTTFVEAVRSRHPPGTA
ncbi:MAG: NAD(P)H-dependent oxidoreductase, partial [Pseudomonadales bacterium]|nr:NAD(P)H-dependent oxidoreductase [Pseudomonadales bacterium]